MRVNTNVSALNTHNNMSRVDLGLGKSLEKLSSGLRINRASDDAGGLAISESMRTQVRGTAQAEKNTQDGIGLLNTAEGALNEISAMLQRARELAVQASNGTMTQNDRDAINIEINQLGLELDRIPASATFNTLPVFTAGAPTTFQLHVGPNAVVGTDTVDIITPDIDSTALMGTAATPPPAAATAYVNASQAAAQAFITQMDTAITAVSQARAQLGAQTNRLEYTVANLQSINENMTAAESRIRDTDMASEMTNLTRHQILMQSSTAMLAQANAQPQSILSLFQ
jgi:flagellin